MGQMFYKHTDSHLWRQDEPDCLEPIQYHPEFGFNKPREPMVLITATKEEMDSVGLTDGHRDECAHARILYRGCKQQYTPFWFMCNKMEAEMTDCYFDSYVRDMKEFERERRLNIRERRIREKAAHDASRT